MNSQIFLVLNLTLAFYNIGTIWAHEVDIFRGWKLLDLKTFRAVQRIHWKKLPYWIFIPVGFSFIGSIILFWYHPLRIPFWQIFIAFILQLLSHLLTAVFWGRWQAELSKDELGGASHYLNKIIKTHWIRTTLINAYGFMLLYMTIEILI